jgi:hypothetical protein
MPQNAKPPLAESLATEASEGSKYKVNIDRYSRARERAINIIEHVEAEHQKTGSPYLASVVDGLKTCANYLHFRHYPTIEQTRLHSAMFCKKHLFCPSCAIRRASKQIQAYLTKLKVLTSENSSQKLYMITLTVKNGDDLEERFEHLNSAIKTLSKNRTRAKTGRHKTEFSKVNGAVGSYEFTNRGNGWHPHAHIVALCDQAPDPFKLSDEWRKITKDSYIVDVRPIDQDNLLKGFSEVFKYALKFSDLTYEQQIHAALTLQGRRLLFSMGSFRGVQVPDTLLDEPLEDLPYIDLFYKYLSGSGYVLQL